MESNLFVLYRDNWDPQKPTPIGWTRYSHLDYDPDTDRLFTTYMIVKTCVKSEK